MQGNLKEIVNELHDCNVEKIEIKQLTFSKDCISDYPKDCFEIIIILNMNHKENNYIKFIFSEINEFKIEKTNFWNWLIFTSELKENNEDYIFLLDDYVSINCNKIDYFFVSTLE